MKKFDLVIIGGGSAGMAAALQAFDDGIKDILILEKDNHLGGILNQCIHNGFGLIEFKKELTGPEFLSLFVDKIIEKKIPYKLKTTVISITKDLKVTYSNEEEFTTIQAKAVILATGCYERNAGAILLPGDRPSGIVTAGTAQKWLNIEGYLVGKKIVILGSGDIGLIMARRLTLEGAKVICVAEIMPYSNGLNRNIVQCLNDFNIPLYLSTSISKVIGKSRVEKVVLSKVDSNFNFIPGTEQEIECDTLLLSVGLIPNVSLINDIKVELSSTKGAIVNEMMETNIDGLFSCGNCLHVHDLVDFVTIEGRNAGHGAACYLKNKFKTNEFISIVNKDNVSYCLPQKVRKSCDEDLVLKFRVKKPLKDCNIEISNSFGFMKKIFKSVLIPSEMEMVTIKRSDLESFLKGDIVVSISQKGDL